MNATMLEEKYGPKLNTKHSLALLMAEDAISLLDDSKAVGLKLLGVEAFRLLPDGRIQPSIEFSNISFGKIVDKQGDPVFTGFKRKLRESWSSSENPFDESRALIHRGVANGFKWYEVSVEDPETGHMLFFKD